MTVGRRTRPPSAPTGADRPVGTSRAGINLAVAAIGFVVNCWAWALVSPLGPVLARSGQLGELSQAQVALLVAVPVVVGSLGRILVGALTDTYGARLMFPLVSALTIVPLLFIAFVGLGSYPLMLLGGFFLGLGGTVFAIGVPLVNACFPPERRGFALGIFGAGMGGTAISALTTVRLFSGLGQTAPFLVTSAVLAGYAVLARVLLRDPAGRTAPTVGLARRVAGTARLPITWQASVLYAVSFGGFVAFSVFLPTYLTTAHGLTSADAANRMAGFVVVAVLMRPLGGALVDRLGPIPVLAASYGVVTVCAALAAGDPPLDGYGTVAFLVMAAALGLGAGAVFGLVSRVADPARVGGVTGLVGAAGGLGGFVPPLIMGVVYGQTSSYAIGLWLLSVTAALVLALTLTVVRATARRPEQTS